MTAQEARKITEEAKVSKNEEQYNDIMKKIKEAADLGEFLTTYMCISGINLKKLESEGYSITEVSWDEYYIRW